LNAYRSSIVRIPVPGAASPLEVGGGSFVLIAGPCSVDRPETFYECAESLKLQGAHALRGAIFKMRTKPDSFQGLGREGLELLAEARRRTALPVVTEVVDPRHLEALDPVVDVYQVGARNMYNYELLKELGLAKKPVLLKRGFTAYLDEWAHAAEYLLRAGNSQVILCERGIRGFDPHTRNVLDLASVPVIRARTGLPVLVDPSHGTGRKDLVEPMSIAALAAGADGLLIEVHPRPEEALSDADQALTPSEFAALHRKIGRVRTALRSEEDFA
jgi:3-deoxy-7-phosphoheptulonate synthase